MGDYVCRRAENEEEQKLVERCYQKGMKNKWANGEYDRMDGNFIVEADRLNRGSLIFIDDPIELEKFFSYAAWMLGQGVIYKNLFFLNQVDGGDEWATYKITDEEIFQFESLTCNAIIRDGEFQDLLKRIEKATNEQLANLEY